VSWLDPLRRALDEAPARLSVFLRDDDAGWADERLVALLDLGAERSLPLDLAVIPRALRPELARALLARLEGAPISLHQHGLAHVNHEPHGRRCEFGPARDRDAQRRDIAEGHRLLVELLGPHVDPIFTPPWNRCTTDTAECLAELGFLALSRESRADPVGPTDLQELPVAVDWFAHRKGERLSPDLLGELLARATERIEPVGIMLHHGRMDEEDLTRAAELLDLLASSRNAVVRPMSALIRSVVS
jgi:hypothetical protein